MTITHQWNAPLQVALSRVRQLADPRSALLVFGTKRRSAKHELLNFSGIFAQLVLRAPAYFFVRRAAS